MRRHLAGPPIVMLLLGAAVAEPPPRTQDDDAFCDPARPPPPAPDGTTVRISRHLPDLQAVYFSAAADQPRKHQQRWIDEVVKTLRMHPTIEKVALVGYAAKDEADAASLAGRRARNLRDLLVGRGIDVARMIEYVGKLAASASRLDAQRRVELRILRACDREIARWDGSAVVSR